MNEYDISEALKSRLPPRKGSARGWESFNCPMCHINGEPSADRRKKGNIIFSGPSFTFRCWRCKYKAHWRPGMRFGEKIDKLFTQLGFTTDELLKLKLQTMQIQQLVSIDHDFEKEYEERPDFEHIRLPSEAIDISEGGELVENEHFQKVVLYVQDLGEQLWSDIFWSPSTKYQMHRRLIIPFYHQNAIVGYTARYAAKNPPSKIPKYMTKCPDGFLYNNHLLDDFNRKFIVLVEGPIDAKAINGVAYLKDSLGPKQINWLNSSGKEIILLPDRGTSAKVAIDQAVDNGWSVAMPREWDHDLKDAHDAYLRYGALWTAESILNAKINNSAAIRQFWKEWK